MNAMKNLIIFLLSLTLVVPYGCATHVRIPTIPVNKLENKSEKTGTIRMAFLLSQEREKEDELYKAISICAEENKIALDSPPDLDTAMDRVSGSIFGIVEGGDMVVPEVVHQRDSHGGPIGAIIAEPIRAIIALPFIIITLPFIVGGFLVGAFAGTRDDSLKMERYRLMQRCVEQKGYICEGFCPDNK